MNVLLMLLEEHLFNFERNICVCVCVCRRVFQWSGWLQRVFSTVFIRFRVTSGLTGSCCGRFSHWVRLKPLYYVAGQFDLHWFLSCWKYWFNWDFFFLFGVMKVHAVLTLVLTRFLLWCDVLEQFDPLILWLKAAGQKIK